MLVLSHALTSLDFNSQPHKEADQYLRKSVYKNSYFNSQPHKEADAIRFFIKLKSGYFNSQPHKEADESKYAPLPEQFISTHSLTRRLTSNLVDFEDITSISTHSLTRRLTAASSFLRRRVMYFNSQPHKEADTATTVVK